MQIGREISAHEVQNDTSERETRCLLRAQSQFQHGIADPHDPLIGAG